MSCLARGPGRRLMTTARCVPTVTPRTLASIATLRPDLSHIRQSPLSPIANQKRHMHWTGPITSAVQASEDALVFLHTTVGLPWYMAIPVFAVGINVAIRFPLQYYSRRIVLKQALASKFTQAWAVRHTFQLPKKTARKLSDRTNARLFKERECQTWKTYLPILSVAPWLVVAQAMRNLTGADGGLVSLVTPEIAHVAEGTSTAAVANASMWIDEITTTAQPVVESIQQSLATGGMLWFPDLTVADPYSILPFVLSISFLNNMLPKGLEDLKAFFIPPKVDNQTGKQKMRARFTRALVMVAVFTPFITMNLPAGMLLYWCWSSSLAGANSAIIDRLLPAPKARPLICKGMPVRLLTQ